ncbi:MAG: helicase-associated domain-containing protein [Planctomycetota bacterium]
MCDLTIEQLREVHAFWSDGKPEGSPVEIEDLRADLRRWWSEPPRIRTRLRTLSKKLQQLLGALLTSERDSVCQTELIQRHELGFFSDYELKAALKALEQRGLAFAWTGLHGEARFGIPLELRQRIRLLQGNDRRRLAMVFTLWGAWREEQRLAGRSLGDLALEEFEALRSPAAIRARIATLSEPLRTLVQSGVEKYGGLVPRSLLTSIIPGLSWHGPIWRVELEEARLGTVHRLDLDESGINLTDDTLVVYAEVVSAVERTAEESSGPWEIREAGVDILHDLSTLLDFIAHERPRMTVAGELYKSSRNRLKAKLRGGSDIGFAQYFSVLYRFVQGIGLVEADDERLLRLSPRCRQWETLPLAEKIEGLVDHLVEDPDFGGETIHQPLMRRLLVSRLRKLPVGNWFDPMVLPFVIRNEFLSRLDRSRAKEEFRIRFQNRPYVALEDPRQMASNLFGWLKNRLHFSGLIDLGRMGGQVRAVRRSALAAELAASGTEREEDRCLLVNPDHEVVVFPEGCTYELLYQLDRFCEPKQSSPVRLYRITRESVAQGALRGLSSRRVLTLLEDHARAPVPKNVAVHLMEWGERVRVLAIRDLLLLKGERAETLDRLCQDELLRDWVVKRPSPTVAVFDPQMTKTRLTARLRELGVLP